MARRFVALLFVLPALSAGCGGGAGDGGADPAAALPPNAPFYADIVVRPEGDRREAMDAFVGRVLGTDDPGERIRGWLDEQLEEEGYSWAEDVEPWLGERMGVAVTSVTSDEPGLVLSLAVKDRDAAQELVDKEREEGRRGSHRGVEYSVGDGDAAGALVDDLLLIGSTTADLEDAIDAAKDDSLAEADKFRAAMGRLPADREGAFFLDFKRIFDDVLQSPQAQSRGLGPLRSLLSGDFQPLAGALLVEEDNAALEVRSKPSKEVPLGLLAFGGATELVGEVPSGSFIALGVPRLGEQFEGALQMFGGAIGSAVINDQLRDIGLDLQRDVLSWVGDVALFIRGDSPDALDGGVVIQATDGAAARAAVGRLIGVARAQGGVPFEPVRVPGAAQAFAAALPGLPRPVVVAVGDDRVVVGLGAKAAAEGLSPKATIADDDIWSRAEELLDGLDPALVLDMPALTALIERALAGDPDFAQVQPYLERFDVVASGSGKDGDLQRDRLAAGAGD